VGRGERINGVGLVFFLLMILTYHVRNIGGLLTSKRTKVKSESKKKDIHHEQEGSKPANNFLTPPLHSSEHLCIYRHSWHT
jgi:Na+-transporting methylmalonyl-CoA/oxaloacetate decarboxylase gamma subunit